jgi:transcriptional regulator with XRE-family HTH domain
VDNSKELRKILSKNIKTIRSKLHISQAKLAEFADISLSYLADIERCRTWVSDKTLQNLANALNIEAWELIFPNNENNGAEQDFISNQKNKIQRIADLISKKREILHRTTDKAMEDLIMEIVKEGS